MSVAKIGMTIEEAAEMVRNRTKHHACSGGLGQAPGTQGRTENHYPDGYVGAFHDRQPGKKSALQGRSKGGGMMLTKSSLSRPRRLRAKYTPRTNLTVRTPGISLLRRACIECSGSLPHIRYREKCCGIFPIAAPSVTDHSRSGNCCMQLPKKNGDEPCHDIRSSR